MNEKEIELVKSLISSVGSAGNKILESYVEWYVISSSMIAVFSFLIITICIRLALVIREDDRNRYEKMIPLVFVIIMFSFVLIYKLSDLMVPEAAALHQIFKDIK